MTPHRHRWLDRFGAAGSLACAAHCALVPLAVAVLAPFLRRDHGEAATGSAVAVPWRPILLVGAAMVLFYMVDTAATTWGPVYLDDTFSTPSGLVALEDDKGVQPVYQPAPIIREEVLTEYPQIEELLTPVFEALTLETLQELNGRVQVGGEAASAVATDFLTQGGFLN